MLTWNTHDKQPNELLLFFYFYKHTNKKKQINKLGVNLIQDFLEFPSKSQWLKSFIYLI